MIFSELPCKFQYVQVQVRYCIRCKKVWIYLNKHKLNAIVNGIIVGFHLSVSRCWHFVMSLFAEKRCWWYFHSFLGKSNLTRSRWDIFSRVTKCESWWRISRWILFWMIYFLNAIDFWSLLTISNGGTNRT